MRRHRESDELEVVGDLFLRVVFLGLLGPGARIVFPMTVERRRHRRPDGHGVSDIAGCHLQPCEQGRDGRERDQESP